MKKNMLANVITLSRIVLAFVTLGLLELKNLIVTAIAVFLIIFIIFLDFLDGYIARKLKISSEFGALFDITGDRIVEIIFWIYFSVRGLVSFWFPVIVISRGIIVDTLRSVAFKKGKKPYEMLHSNVSHFLVASPFMRTSYAVMKAITFSLLGINLLLKYAAFPHVHTFHSATIIFAYITLLQCIARGIPVIVDSRFYLFEKKENGQN